MEGGGCWGMGWHQSYPMFVEQRGKSTGIIGPRLVSIRGPTGVFCLRLSVEEIGPSSHAGPVYLGGDGRI